MSQFATRSCRSCGATNRIPVRHLASLGRCGSCKATLAPQSEPLDVDQAMFDAVIQEVRVPILVDFWAEWCGPCRMAAPEVHALAEELAGNALVLKVDTEQQQSLAARSISAAFPHSWFLIVARLFLTVLVWLREQKCDVGYSSLCDHRGRWPELRAH